MLIVRNREDALKKIEQLELSRKKILLEKEKLEKICDELERKIQMEISEFVPTGSAYLKKLDSNYDKIETYDYQIKKIDKMMEKIKTKYITNNKR